MEHTAVRCNNGTIEWVATRGAKQSKSRPSDSMALKHARSTGWAIHPFIQNNDPGTGPVTTKKMGKVGRGGVPSLVCVRWLPYSPF
jgi:hypothetical protein